VKILKIIKSQSLTSYTKLKLDDRSIDTVNHVEFKSKMSVHILTEKYTILGFLKNLDGLCMLVS